MSRYRTGQRYRQPYWRSDPVPQLVVVSHRRRRLQLAHLATVRDGNLERPAGVVGWDRAVDADRILAGARRLDHHRGHDRHHHPGAGYPRFPGFSAGQFGSVEGAQRPRVVRSWVQRTCRQVVPSRSARSARTCSSARRAVSSPSGTSRPATSCRSRVSTSASSAAATFRMVDRAALDPAHQFIFVGGRNRCCAPCLLSPYRAPISLQVAPAARASATVLASRASRCSSELRTASSLVSGSGMARKLSSARWKRLTCTGSATRRE